jgi:hypothetical protein
MPTEEMINRSFDMSNITSEYTKKQVKAGVTSYFCANVDEMVPEFDQAPCEETYQGNHNSFIILGRDRHANWASGMGGAGMHQCGMIDLVAGRGHLTIQNNINENKKDILEGASFVGPMFHSDAARIYITQKCENIDKYFGLKTSGGVTSTHKSAIGIKADQLRIIGREKVKIYAGQGNFSGFDPSIGETNCLGERLKGQVIELQVGNQELHPMVLGNNLIDYLKKQNAAQKKVHKTLFNVNINLAAINAALTVLTAGAPPFSMMARSSIEDLTESITENLNIYLRQLNSLDNDLIPGADHILSNSVYTT